MRRLRFSIIVLLVLLSVQGWIGDYVNLFAVFPTGPVSNSLSGFAQALQQAGLAETFHASLGFLILALSVIVLVLSFTQKLASVRITSILALIAVVSGVIGGLLFVFSGFTDNGSSAQMGGSFIGGYAFYFLELYYDKGQPPK